MVPPKPFVLDLQEARAAASRYDSPAPPLTLQLAPGELILVEARNLAIAAWFADLCCGLVPLAGGTARFLGRSWADVPHAYACAMRGHIGRVFAEGGWIGFLDVATNVLLPHLHHNRDAPDNLREQAIALALDFGLPGLPLDPVGNLSQIDLARAACVRAFLGDPALVVLESPLQGWFRDLLEPLVNTLTAARHGGAAAIWFMHEDSIWGDRNIPADWRYRLDEYGLSPLGSVP
jgi:phospholipid/cholesterol/gamma-HCH transport system ATP-binding protein